MSKISDEIRDYCKWCDKHSAARDSLCKLADRIDAEMMELPRDRDGVPIHVGDTVYLDDGRTAKVTRIGIGMDEDSIYTILYGDDFSLTPGYVTHERPDSWERIADELDEWREDNRVNGDSEVFDRAGIFADRIRTLAEKEH